MKFVMKTLVKVQLSACLLLSLCSLATGQWVQQEACYVFPLNANVWSQASSWPNNMVPATGTVAHIPAGTTMYLDRSPNALEGIEVEGTLIFICRDLNVSADWIRVTGRLEAGTANKPFLREAIITLTDDYPDDASAPGNKMLVVEGTGELILRGEPHGPSWKRIASTAAKNQDQLVLQSAPDWNVGDSIVIASTDFDMTQAEEREILAISGSTLTLDQDLMYEHWGATEGPAPGVEEYAEVGLLTRNIVVQGSPNMTGSPEMAGHVIVRNATGAGPIVRLSWVEFRNLGNEGTLGQYPVHFHQLGTQVDAFVRNCSIHHSSNRGVVVHGTQGIELTNNVVFDTIGHGYYMEDGSETDCVWKGNLGLVTRAATVCVDPPDCTDEEPATFWVRNNDNILEDNAAGGSDFYGFWLGEDTLSPTPITSFTRNVAHSNGHSGFYQNTRPMPTAANPGIWHDLTTYKNRRTGVWFRSYGICELNNIKSADNESGFYVASTGTPAGLPLPSLTTLKDSLAVGESNNLGEPLSALELQHGRSLPQTAPWLPGTPQIDALMGYEIYDGPIAVVDTHFANFEDFDYTLVNPAWLRKAGAFHQVQALVSPWAMDPTNYVEGVSFEQPGTRPLYFRDAQPGANGIAMASLLDLDGSLSGTAGAYVFANTNFLVPASGSTFDTDWNANIVVPSQGQVYGQLDFKNTDVVNLPDELDLINVNDPTKVFRIMTPTEVTSEHFVASVPIDTSPSVNDVYLYAGLSGDPVPQTFRLTLRFTAPNQSILVGVPFAAGGTTVTHNGTPMAISTINQVLTGSGNAWAFFNGLYVFRLTTGGTGTTVFDGTPTEFEVL